MHALCLPFPKHEHEEILRNTFWILADPSAFIIYDHLVNSCLFVLSLFISSSFLIEQDWIISSTVSLSPSQHTGARMCNGSLVFGFIFTKHNDFKSRMLVFYVYVLVFFCFLVIFKIGC